MATQLPAQKRTAVRVLEERLEELEAENETLREEKDALADVAKQFRDTLSEIDFDDEEDEDEEEIEDDELEDDVLT